VPTETELAAEYRAAETRLLADFGLTATERMVDAGDAQLHVIDIPGDAARPPVVLLHGIASVTAAAVPLIPGFGGRRVIALDWPGHGLSSAATLHRHDIRTAPVRWLQAVIDAYGLETFELVGHSMGGQFGLYYALAHPERVRSLTLLGAPGAAFAEMHPPAGMRVMAFPGVAGRMLRRPVTRAEYQANSAMTLGPGAVEPWPPELVDCGYLASLREAFVESLPSYFKAIASPLGVRRSAVVTQTQLATLPMPVLLLWGDADVFLTVARAGGSIAAIADAAVVELHGGHAPWLNAPEEARAAMARFLG
jgi:pimeloyl-ACP methyl ester carboxylesterase